MLFSFEVMKSITSAVLLLYFVISGCTSNIVADEYLLENLLRSQPKHFGHILDNREKYEVQIIYTQIERDAVNKPIFKSFTFNTNNNRYFYPASTVKLPVALLALEKINELDIPGLTAQTAMLTDSAFSGQAPALVDTTAPSGLPSIAHYIKKILLVSDNDAYNRLYEFIGQKEIGNKLKAKGYDDSKIIHRLSLFLTDEENRHTNPIHFMNNDSLIYAQPAAYNASDRLPGDPIHKGKGYMKDGKLISEPMDFSGKNFFPLDEMQMVLRAVMFPEHVERQKTFDLTETDYRFIYQYMSQLPSESDYPEYNTDKYYDAYSKFLMYGDDKRPIPKNIRIFNKIGQSYGYLIDNAYIIDLENNVEFMLSAVIHTNQNEIYNDNEYEYEEIGYPFMKQLGRLIYDYELKRNRPYPPDLTNYKVAYDR